MSTPLSRLRSVIRAALDGGETQVSLARRLGVSQPAVHGWLKEDGLDPKASVLGAVAKKLGVSGHWLLTGEGDRYAPTTGADALFDRGYVAGVRQAMVAAAALLTAEGRRDRREPTPAIVAEILAEDATLDRLPAEPARPSRRPPRKKQA